MTHALLLSSLAHAAEGTTTDPRLTWIALAVAVVALLLFALSRKRAPTEAESAEEEAPLPDTDTQSEARKRSRWGLQKTRQEGFIARLSQLLTTREELDEGFLDELEATLVKADLGVRTSQALLEDVREAMSQGLDTDRLWSLLRSRALEILSRANPSPSGDTEGPHVVLVVGVNGSGKTTSIGKLAHNFVHGGKTVMLAAGDTFRAAAGDQLEIWADRVGAPIVRGREQADPSSVFFEAIERGVTEGVDVVLCDTAGRLHTKLPLMEELKKIRRVCGKACPGAPHEVLLVVDATTGQNAILQARDFSAAVDVTGVVLTKLDGTAKGGVILGICDELDVPVRYVGVGETAEDLRVFEAADFVDALFSDVAATPDSTT